MEEGSIALIRIAVKAFRSILLALCLLVLPALVAADDEIDRHWTEVRQLLKQGAYRDALQSLELLRRMTPDDPRAQLYYALCELRLQSPPVFNQLAPETLQAMQARLQQEERQHKRVRAQSKALERQVKKEQARWDRELNTLERQAEQEGRAAARTQHQQEQAVVRTKRQQEQAAAIAQVQAQRAQQKREAAVIEAPPKAERPSEIETPVAPDAAPETPTIAEAPPGSVALERVTVTTQAGASLPAPAPSVARSTPVPSGAVQINAKQMSVSPDRNVAVADGDVEVIYDNVVLTADHLTLFTDTKDVYAEGRVRLEEETEKGPQVFRGEMVHYNFENKQGRFLQGTMSAPPLHEHGRSVEHVAEGVFEVTPGYLTTCEMEPPHFKLYGRRAIVFADDKLAKAKNVAFIVDHLPLMYFPQMVLADRQTPFFIIPGKKKPWGPFVLMGYRYELPGPLKQKGTVKMDWRRYFLWGFGLDHWIESERYGQALLKVYYNEEQDLSVANPKASLPKGAAQKRYRVLWRHKWMPYPDTTMITDIQEYSDKNFRRDFLFREEHVQDDVADSFVSVVKNAEGFTVSGLAKKRMNRFQNTEDVLPQITVDVRSQRIGDTWLFSESRLDFANWQRKTAHSEEDAAVQRLDWFEQLSYALNWFQPVSVTPKAAVRQTYYTKDIQGSNRHDGLRDFLSGQFTSGVDTSLKLFRIFPVVTNAFGLDINLLRHVLTPTINYSYVHEPTVPNELLNFSAASGPSNAFTFGLENKLQTKRVVREGQAPTSVDLVRFITSVPYSFRGSGNKRGGRIGDWSFDLEMYPWSRLRLETDWTQISNRDKLTQESHVPHWNVDLVMVGGEGEPMAQNASDIQAPALRTFEPGPTNALDMLPKGQWYLGYSHRYSSNDKIEDVLQYDWRLSPKWQIGTFHRFDWKEVIDGSKRFYNLREYQYSLRRDLHDWIGEVVYRVDREFGEELYLTFTLKAYPNMPIGISDGYHQPKLGSQSSPFSPLRTP